MINTKFMRYVLCLTIPTLLGSSISCLAAQNSTALLQNFIDLDACFTQSVYSFVFPSSYPPTSTQDLEAACKYQAAGFKCLKDKSKNLPSLIQRGIGSFVKTRQRYNKKFCTNFNSDASKQYVRDIKCIMDKKLPVYRDADAHMINSMTETRRRNYNDSAIELKYICCNLIGYRKKIIDSVGSECQSSKSTIEEMIMSIVSNDINLICDDEEKLTLKVCPTLEPYKIPKEVQPGEIGPSATILYLILTLGEPDAKIK